MSLLLTALLGIWLAGSASSAALELEAKISLGDIHGRIDHLAVDSGRQRLYVAELGNDSIGVVDLQAHKLLRTLVGLREPQGIGYVPSSDTLYVANGGDGSVRLFRGADLTPIGTIALGADADNVRVDDAAHRVYVGHGSGAIAVIDTVSQRKLADIALTGHPESFQLDPSSARIFVNVPDARQVAVVDRLAYRQVTSWPLHDLRANFPLAWDESHNAVVVVFRHPSKVGLFRPQDGQLLTSLGTCDDADDAFVDRKRNRLYVSCGEGVIDVLGRQGESYSSMCHIATAPGARTGIFVPETDRFYLAVRATGTTPAGIWVFRPTPIP